MYAVDLYGRVRRACHVDGMSKSEAARMFGIDRKTVAKILKHSVPPGYRRSKPPVRPKLDPFIPIIDRILEDDKGQLAKQRHTATRIFERLRDEHGFTGKLTIVTDYVRERKRRTREVFVPLAHPPGHAQVDFGEAVGVIGGTRRKLHYFAMALPHSDAFFIKAYLSPMEFLTTTAATAPETLAVSALPLNTQTRPGNSRSSRPDSGGRSTSGAMFHGNNSSSLLIGRSAMRVSTSRR